MSYYYILTHSYAFDDLSGAFSSLSLGNQLVFAPALQLQGGRKDDSGIGRRFPEYEDELKQRPLSSARKLAPPSEGPCACVDNQTVRRRLGVVGDPSVDVDHIYERHAAFARGWNPDIEVNKEPAPASLNRRWGQLYCYGKYELVEEEKREYYGNARYEEAMEGMAHCNKRYNYRKA